MSNYLTIQSVDLIIYLSMLPEEDWIVPGWNTPVSNLDPSELNHVHYEYVGDRKDCRQHPHKESHLNKTIGRS